MKLLAYPNEFLSYHVLYVHTFGSSLRGNEVTVAIYWLRYARTLLFITKKYKNSLQSLYYKILCPVQYLRTF